MGQGTQPNHYVTNSNNNTKTRPNDAGKNMSAEDKAAFGKTLDKIVADSKAKAKAENDRRLAESKFPKYMRSEKYKNWNPK